MAVFPASAKSRYRYGRCTEAYIQLCCSSRPCESSWSPSLTRPSTMPSIVGLRTSLNHHNSPIAQGCQLIQVSSKLITALQSRTFSNRSSLNSTINRGNGPASRSPPPIDRGLTIVPPSPLALPLSHPARFSACSARLLGLEERTLGLPHAAVCYPDRWTATGNHSANPVDGYIGSALYKCSFAPDLPPSFLTSCSSSFTVNSQHHRNLYHFFTYPVNNTSLSR